MILEQYILGLHRNNEEKQYGPPKHWRMSNLGKCPRYQVLQRLNLKGKPFKDDTLFIFEIGHMIEEMVMRFLGSLVVARQTTVVADKFDAVGHLDALILKDNELFPLEVKSTRDAALGYRTPYETHKKQASAYALYMGLKRSVVLYLGRDGAYAEAIVEAEPQRAAIENEWRLLNTVWEQLGERLDNESEDDYYVRNESILPPKLPVVEKTYVKSGRWGKAGDIKTTIAAECARCPYTNRCFPWLNISTGPSVASDDTSAGEGKIGVGLDAASIGE